MKFLMISPKNRTVYNFRGNLIKEIVNRGYSVIVTGPDETDIDKIRSLGADFRKISMNKNGTSVFDDIKYCWKLIKVMRNEKPEVILGYTVKPVVYGAIAAKLSRIKNINCMITGGGYTFTSKTVKAQILGIIVRILYKVGLSCADHVIFQNTDDLNEFVERKLVKKSKCSVVHGSGVDMEKFSRENFPNTISFFMLSRLLKSKGVYEYLKAAESVKIKYPDVKFSLLGKYETSMQDAVDKKFVEDLIQRGIVERYDETTDVRPFYKACSVYVLPSYREGTPRTVLEAMAMGRPIITTDTNGCRETVRDAENGFLVPVKDIEALADRMEKFILHPELIYRMGNAAYELCKEKYEVNRVNQDMIKFMGLERE